MQIGAPPAIHSCNFKEVYELLGEKKLLSLKQNADPVLQLGTLFSCQPTDMVYNLPRASLNFPHTTLGYLNGWRSIGQSYIATNGAKFNLYKPSFISEFLYKINNRLDDCLTTIFDKFDKFTRAISYTFNKIPNTIINSFNTGMKFIRKKYYGLNQ